MDPELIDKKLKALLGENLESDSETEIAFEDLVSILNIRPELTEELINKLSKGSQNRKLLVETFLAWKKSSENPRPLASHIRKKILKKISPEVSVSIPKFLFDSAKNILKTFSGEELGFVSMAIPVRNERTLKTYSVQVDDFSVQVAIDKNDSGSYEMWVKLIQEDSVSSRCEWQLFKDNTLIEHQPALGGEALFLNLSEGEYLFKVRLGGNEIGSFNISLSE